MKHYNVFRNVVDIVKIPVIVMVLSLTINVWRLCSEWGYDTFDVMSSNLDVVGYIFVFLILLVAVATAGYNRGYLDGIKEINGSNNDGSNTSNVPNNL